MKEFKKGGMRMKTARKIMRCKEEHGEAEAVRRYRQIRVDLAELVIDGKVPEGKRPRIPFSKYPSPQETAWLKKYNEYTEAKNRPWPPGK